MKLRNKKLFFDLGSLLAIAPLPIVSVNLEQTKNNNNDNNLQFKKNQPPEFIFKQIPGVPNKITNILHTKSNKIFLAGGESGLWVSIDNGKTFNQVKPEGLYWNNVSAIFQASNGKIFVGTYGNGLYVSTDDGFTFSNAGIHIWGLFVEQVYESIDKRIFVAANHDGLWVSEDGGNTFDYISSSRGSYNNWQVFWVYLLDNNIFIGTDCCIAMSVNDGYSFEGIKWISDPQDSDEWNCFYQSPQGRVFLGTRKLGLYLSNNNGINYVKLETWPLPDETEITFICTGPNDEMLIGTKNSGLWVSNDEGQTFTEANPQFWNGKTILTICQTSDGQIFVGTNNGLWVSFVGISCSFAQKSNHVDILIDDKRNIISNQEIEITITNPILKVNIGDKDYNVTPEGPFKQKMTFGKHNFIVTYNNGTNYSFIVWIKNSIIINSTNFTTDSAYTLEQYQGYLNSDENKPVQVVSVKGNIGQPSLYLNLSDKTIDFSKSNYQPLNDSFAPVGKEKLLDGQQTIFANNGLYLLRIIDNVGNFVSYYLQIGGKENAIPKSFYENDIFIASTGSTLKQNFIVNGKNFDYVANGDITYLCKDKMIENIKISQVDGITEDIKDNIFNFSKTLKISDTTTQYKISTFYKGIEVKTYDIMLISPTINENKNFNVENNGGIIYQGYWKGRTLDVISFLDVNTVAKNSVTLNLNPNQINLDGRSYYRQIDISTLTPKTNPLPITITNQTITGVGMYEVHLADFFGQEKTYYVQVGGNKNIIPPISKNHNSAISNWKVLIFVLSGLVVAILSIALFIRYKPKKIKSIASVKHKQGIISDKELEEMKKEEERRQNNEKENF